MTRIKLKWLGVAAVCGLLVAMPLGGCGGGEEEASAEPVAATNAFPTADAMLAEFNRVMQGDPGGRTQLATMIYAENEQQKSLVEIINFAVRVEDIKRMSIEKFGAAPKQLAGGKANPFAGLEETMVEPATITRRMDRRVEGSYKVNSKVKGTRVKTLQLVEFNGRWWVSGYSFEDEPTKKDDFAKGVERGFMDGMRQMMSQMIGDIDVRLRSGQISSLEQLESELAANEEKAMKSMQGGPGLPR